MTEDDWPSDAAIETYLTEKTDVLNQKWSQRRINGLKEKENPILDSHAKELMDNESLKQNPTINLLSSSCTTFDTNQVYEVPNSYIPGRKLVFRSELSDATISKTINPSIEVSGIAAQFANQNDNCDSLNINLNPKTNLYQWQYLLLDVDDLTVPGTSFEPIACSVFIIDNKKVCSQRWNFFTPYSRTFFDCKTHSQHAAIDISGLSDNAYLAVIYYRIFQVDNGDVCNSYYKKPSDAGLQKARASVNSTIQRLRDCWTPFAFSYVSLKSIQGSADFPNAYLPEKPLTGEYISQQIEKVKGKLDALPITLKLKSQIKKASHPSMINEDYLLIRSIEPDVNQPIFEYRHQMIITLNAAKFDSKVNARNIVAQLSFINGDKPIAAFHNNWKDASLCEAVFSRCIYHEKNPTYEDEFIIDLPINLEPTARVQISYYHAATQEKETALRIIGTANLPLIVDNRIIKDGMNTIEIGLPGIASAKGVMSSSQIIKTQLYSTIMSQDSLLMPMFTGKIPAVDHIPDSLVINFLYQILDSFIDGINSNQPRASVFGIISIGRIISIVNPQHLAGLLSIYASNFAFRKESSRGKNMHTSLLKFWHEYLNKEEKKRKDIYVSAFMFTLILKSIVVTKDREFSEAFMPFFLKLKELSSSLAQSNLNEAKIFNEAFATFIGELTDIGYYEFSGNLIIEYSNSFGNTENDFEALTHFIDFAIHPKLFIALSLANDKFVNYFADLMSRAVDTPNSRSFQRVFKVFGRLLLFIPEKNCDDIASKYVNLLEIFTNKEVKAQQPDELRFLLADLVFIFRFVRHNEFQDFYAKVDHEKFNNLLHFVLTKTRISYRQVSDISESQKFSVNEAMELVRKNSRKSIHGTAEGISVSSNAVRDAMIAEAMTRSQSADLNDSLANEARELSLDAQLSVLHVVTLILTIGNPTDAPNLVLDMIYHILSANICIDIARQIKDIVFMYIEKYAKDLLVSQAPPFALFLMKLFSLIATKNSAVAEELVSILPRFFSAELRLYPSNNRSLVCAIRAISKMKDDAVESPVLKKALESRSDNGGNIDKITNCINTIAELNRDMRFIDPDHFKELRLTQKVNPATKSEINIEKYSQDILMRSRAYAASPDASAEELQILSSYNFHNGYFSEGMLAQIYQIALIVEYLTVLNRIPNAYNIDHPALVFKSTCTSVIDHICPDDILKDPPIVPTYCDSPTFSDSGIYVLLNDIYKYCKNAKLFEIANEVLRLTYPILEQRSLFLELSKQFTNAKMNYTVMKALSTNMDRMLGRYYRIAYYGKIFGTDDGKMFVQRETKLAHLFDVTGRIKNTYISLFGAEKIQIITESGFVDRKLLDPEKGYIQLTFVEPYFEKSELEKRVTVYECGSKLGMFKFETPFVKGEKKLQGSVETQWQRRTILKVKATMPAVTKRIEVPPEGFIVVEYEPIRVASRQIKERILSYEDAIKKNDHQAIQPLLHGSLLVQVNEGPSKMAEVFLGSPLRTKHTEKMRKMFQRFLDLNAQGLAIHGDFVRKNPGFQELQNQLEEGLRNLTAKLAPYLYPQ